MAVDSAFFGKPVPHSLEELGRHLNIEIPAEAAGHNIDAIGAPEDATDTTLSFYSPCKSEEKRILPPRKGACLVDERYAHLVPEGVIRLITPNPRMAFADACALFYPPAKVEPRIAATAVISPGAQVDPSARIDDYAVIADGAHIGPNVHVGAHTVIGRDVKLAANVHIGSQVTIEHAVQIGEGSKIEKHSSVEYATIGKHVHIGPHCSIGAESFGYVVDQPSARVEPFPQLGRVILHDHVGIHANTQINRGALEDTVIHELSKIGNNCLIAHGCTVGTRTGIAPGAQLMGSVVLGNDVMVYAGARIRDHVTVGNGAIVGMESNVLRNVRSGETVMGNPAMSPSDRTLRENGMLSKRTGFDGGR